MVQDIRVLKTKRDIEAALTNLILTQGFYSLTVQDICKQALVSRSTFYSHYLDKYDIIEQLIAKTLDPLQEKFAAKYGENLDNGQLKDFLGDIYQFYQENTALLKALLKTPLDNQQGFEEQFDQLCQLYIKELLLREGTSYNLPLELLTQLYASIVRSLMKWTIEHGPNEDLTDFTYRMHKAFLNII
ncbi:TetR/AcrR family transcriptional regulator [Streptococcus dentasini]